MRGKQDFEETRMREKRGKIIIIIKKDTKYKKIGLKKIRKKQGRVRNHLRKRKEEGKKEEQEEKETQNVK